MTEEKWENGRRAGVKESGNESGKEEVYIQRESEDSEGSNEEQDGFIEVQGERPIVEKSSSPLSSVSEADLKWVYSTDMQTTFESRSEYEAHLKAIRDLSDVNDYSQDDNSSDREPQEEPDLSITDNMQPPEEIEENLTRQVFAMEAIVSNPNSQGDESKNPSDTPLWYIPLQEKLHKHGFVIPYGQLIPMQSQAWRILTHEEKSILETQYYGCKPRMNLNLWETLNATRKKSIHQKRQKKIRKAFRLAEKEKGEGKDSAIQNLLQPSQTLQKTAENDIQVSTKAVENVLPDTLGLRRREYFESAEGTELKSDEPPRTKRRKTGPVSAVSLDLNDNERGRNDQEHSVPPVAGTRTDGRLDIYQRIALEMMEKKQKNKDAENAPLSVEPIEVDPKTRESNNLNGENHYICFDIQSFFAAHRYTNPLVMDALKDSGFSKYELLTMKGQKKHEIMERFKTIIPEDCFLRQAQLESLSHVVSSASMESWNKLENASA